jgi:4-hydroxy-tetrahydrodipicolinate synthase
MFKGLYTALITPFDPLGNLDLDSLENLVKRQLAGRVDGIIIFGTTGEGMTLTQEEKNEVVKLVIELVQKQSLEERHLVDGKPYRPKIIVGTGTNCTKTTIAQSLEAQKLGADAVMIVTPYYNRPSQEGLFRHYSVINDALNLPIMLYNIPSRTGVNLEDITLIRLIRLSNVAALKDYDSLRPIRLYLDWKREQIDLQEKNILKPEDAFLMEAMSQYELFLGACSDNFTILAGDDVNSLSIYVNGGHGTVSVASNLVPKISLELQEAARNFKMKKAQALQAYLYPLYQTLFCEVNPVPVKYAAYLMGLIKTPVVRQPLYSLSNSNKEEVAKILKSYGLI